MSGAPVFAATAQGMPLHRLALGASGTCIPGSQGTVTIGETVLARLPPPGHCTDHRLKLLPSLSVKEAYLLILGLQPEGQALGLPHI